MPRTSVGAVELSWEERGSGTPLLLIMGVGAQRAHWPPGFLDALADRGHRVITFDNRDVGESTWLDGAPLYPVPTLFWARLTGARLDVAYDLSDMAADSVGLLDALELDSAHVVGVSMGGMIAQHMAIEHPTRVRSLVSIMSTPGHVLGMLGKPYAMKALLTPPPDRSRSTYIERNVSFFKTVGGTLATDEAGLRERAALAYDRGDNRPGVARQFAAMVASGSRKATLRSVTAPTLVIHGSVDPLVLPRSGRATAAAIPGSRFVEIPGMGHELAPPSWPTVVHEITTHVETAEA